MLKLETEKLEVGQNKLFPFCRFEKTGNVLHFVPEKREILSSKQKCKTLVPEYGIRKGKLHLPADRFLVQ